MTASNLSKRHTTGVGGGGGSRPVIWTPKPRVLSIGLCYFPAYLLAEFFVCLFLCLSVNGFFLFFLLLLFCNIGKIILSQYIFKEFLMF